MRLIDLHREKKMREDAARWWRDLGSTYDDFAVPPSKAGGSTRERERCFLFDCINTNLARIAELDILSALSQVTLVLLLALALPFAAHAAEKAPRHVTRPVSSITVKVVTDADYQRKAKGADPTVTRDGRPAQWIITALDADSCTAWISAKAPNVITAELAAFKACRVAIGARGGAVARDEAKVTFPACTSEDASTGPSPCLWDCKTMGNRQCGPGPRYTVITKD